MEELSRRWQMFRIAGHLLRSIRNARNHEGPCKDVRRMEVFSRSLTAAFVEFGTIVLHFTSVRTHRERLSDLPVAPL